MKAIAWFTALMVLTVYPVSAHANNSDTTNLIEEIQGNLNSTLFVDGEEILITQSGIYEFSGEYNTSTITVNVDKNVDEGIVYLILNNASINTDIGTPINIIEAKDVVIQLADGSHNTIIQGSETLENTGLPSGAIYSKADTVITGTGTLVVETAYEDGINSRDDLIIEGGATIVVTAVEDGIVGKDLLQISDSIITIECGKDGLKSSNSSDESKGNIIITSGEFNITAENDAISSDNTIQIDGGTFNLISGGGFIGIEIDPTANFQGGGGGSFFTETPEVDDGIPSTKGIKAESDIEINGGNFNISSLDDAIHSNSNIVINDGIFELQSGDDAIHADAHLQINGGTINILDCYEGLEGRLSVEINDGNISIVSADDSINASDGKSGDIRVNGGTVQIYYYGPGADGFDSNNDFTQTGGDIIIVNTHVGTNTAGAFDIHGTIIQTGGTIIDGNGNDVDITTFIRSGTKMTTTDGANAGSMQQGNFTDMRTQAEPTNGTKTNNMPRQ